MKEIEKFKNQAAQGDVLLTRINVLPSDCIKQPTESSEHVIAHSESGHNHAISSDGIDLYEAANDPLIAYLVVNKTNILIHAKTGPTQHGPLQVSEGIYRINRQREQSPEGWRRAID